MSFSEANIKKYASENTSSGLRCAEFEMEGGFCSEERAHQPGGPRGLMGGIGISTVSFTCFVGDSFTIKLGIASRSWCTLMVMRNRFVLTRGYKKIHIFYWSTFIFTTVKKFGVEFSCF